MYSLIFLKTAPCTMCLTCEYSWFDNDREGVSERSIVGPTLALIFVMPNLPFSQTILNQFLLHTPFLAHVFTVRSVNESHVMCCIVIVLLNSS